MIPFKSTLPRSIFYEFFSVSCILFTIFVTQSLVFPEILYGDSLMLRWNRNDEMDLAGYKVHYGTEPTAYEWVTDVGDTTEYDLSELSLSENIPYIAYMF